MEESKTFYVVVTICVILILYRLSLIKESFKKMRESQEQARSKETKKVSLREKLPMLILAMLFAAAFTFVLESTSDIVTKFLKDILASFDIIL